MYLADPLSRDCSNDLNKEAEEESLEIQMILSISDNGLETLKKEVKADNTFQLLINFINNGWPKAKEKILYATDLFHFNNNDYIVFIDCFSGYLKFKILNETTTKQVILFLKEIFSTFGPPLTLETDNGPQFSSSEFKSFSRAWNFNHRTSSPYHPSGNGLAEKAMQIAKNILKKSTYDNSDHYLGILNYMNTPRGNLGSPAQRLFGHAIRSILPTTKDTLLSSESKRISEYLKKEREKQSEYANRGAKNSSPHLATGEMVVTRSGNQSLWRPAVIKKQIHPRSYVVEDPNGNEYRRNSQNLRKSLAKITPVPEIVAESDNVPFKGEDNCQTSLDRNADPTVLRRSSRIKTQPQRLQYN